MTTVTLTKVEKSKLRPKYNELSLREKLLSIDVRYVGWLDIEANGLKGNFANLISWYMEIWDVKTNKRKLIGDVLRRSDIDLYTKRKAKTRDKRIVESVLKALNDVDMVVCHYGVGWGKMDMPFIRTRTAFNFGNLEPLKQHRNIRYFDTWPTAHKLLSLHSYRLDVVAEALGVKTQKSPVTAEHWVRGNDGDKESLEYIALHNRKDVKILREVFLKLAPHVPLSGWQF